LVGAPARQPDLVRASRKSGGGAAEGSTYNSRPIVIRLAPFSVTLTLNDLYPDLKMKIFDAECVIDSTR